MSTEYVPSSFLVMPRQRLFQSGNATSHFRADAGHFRPWGAAARRGPPPQFGALLLGGTICEAGTELVDGDLVVGLAGLLGKNLVRRKMLPAAPILEDLGALDVRASLRCPCGVFLLVSTGWLATLRGVVL